MGAGLALILAYLFFASLPVPGCTLFVLTSNHWRTG
jgi:hypothetical protein